MQVEEFKSKLIKLISCAKDDVSASKDDTSATDKHTPVLIIICKRLIAYAYPEKKGFITEDSIDEHYQFLIPQLSESTLVVKKEVIEQEDPPLFAIVKKKLTPFTENLSTVLITEFAYWLSSNSDFSVTHKYKGFALSSLIVKNMTLFFKQRDYPNKIWMKENTPLFLMDMTEQQKVILVAANENDLNEAILFLKIEAKPSEKNEDPKPNKNKSANAFFTEEKKEGNVLTGFAPFPNYKELINVSFDSENDSGKDIKKLIEKVQKIISSTYGEEENKLKLRIAKKVTNAAYGQSDHKPTASDYEALVNDLKLAEANFYPKEFILIYRAPQVYSESDIVVQLNYKYNIAEVTVH